MYINLHFTHVFSLTFDLIFSALLPLLLCHFFFSTRAREVDHQLETWEAAAHRIVQTPQAPHLDWSF